jgi:hypothetical protein
MHFTAIGPIGAESLDQQRPFRLALRRVEKLGQRR